MNWDEVSIEEAATLMMFGFLTVAVSESSEDINGQLVLQAI